MVEIRTPTSAELSGLGSLLEAVSSDGAEALSEHKTVRIGNEAEVCEVVAADDGVVGYAQAAWHRPAAPGDAGHWAIELATTAGSDVGSELVRSVVARLAAGARWVLWARRDVEDEVAARLGLRCTRTLVRLEVGLPLAEAPLEFPDVLVTGFRPGRDEDAWIEANNAAFAGHPENGAVTIDDLTRRMEAEWYDPEGVRMAWSDGVLLGSCWTKVHPDGAGEIYIIGVRPDAAGRGLGRLLVVEGLRHLSVDCGASSAVLWVEKTNAPARRLYGSLGFWEAARIRSYEPVG